MTTYESRDSVALYLDPARKVFVVAQQARRGRGRTETGELLEIPDCEFESQIGAAVLSCLDRFQRNAYVLDGTGSRTPAEARKFIRQHLCVNVERTSGGELVIQPLHHEEGGYTGRENEHVVLSKSELPHGIPAALRKAFEFAT